MRQFLIILINLFFIISIQAQTTQKFTFEQEPLETVISQIEKEYKIECFFIRDWVLGRKVSGTFEAESAKVLLEKILKRESLKPVQYDSFTFIFTKEIKTGEIVEEFTAGGDVIKKVFLGDASSTQSSATIRGEVIDAEEKTPLVGAAIHIKSLAKGVATDSAGKFEILLPVGEHEVEVSNIGYHKDELHIMLRSDDEIEIPLVSSINSLDEVVIKGERENVHISEGQMSANVVKMEDVQYVPTLMGERDVIKTIELLPGVNATGEGANGYSVRGGNAGQNLIFLEGAPLYNPSHLFGFFSVFNSGVVEDATIYKGAIPAQYGGRVSSVMDITLKDGLTKGWNGEAGISIMSSRMSIEGPITKKLSLLAGGRISYINRFLERVENPDLRSSRGDFYDLNTKLTYALNDNNTIVINSFLSKDKFTLPIGDDISYGNLLSSVKWNHKFSDDAVGNFTASYSGYYSTIDSGDSLQSLSTRNEISTYTLKGSTTLYNFDKHALNFGMETGITTVNPGIITSIISKDQVEKEQIEKERGVESAIFISDEYELNDKITINLGFRYSHFLAVGAGKEYLYRLNEEKRQGSIIDTLHYESGEIMHSYGGLEPRLFLKYAFNNSLSLKFNFGRSRQYLHLVSNSASVSPLNIWKLSDRHLKPQIADQVAIGLFKNFFKHSIELSGEVFYKNVSDLPDYKNGAQLLANPNLERELVSGEGKAYGLEFQFTKKTGKLSGWIGYTYARSLNTMDSPIKEEKINNGSEYSSDNDRPHAISVSGDYWLSRLWSLSFNWVYNTGRPISFPEAIYYHEGMQVAYYSDRNEYRIPDYHRLDLSFNWKGTSLKKNKKWDASWAFTLYNVYGRRNAYSIFFQREANQIVGRKLSILARPLPSVTLNIKF